MTSDELKNSIDILDKELGGKSELKTKKSLTLLNEVVQKLKDQDTNNKEYFNKISEFLNKIIESNNKANDTNEPLEEKIENLNEVNESLREIAKLLKSDLDKDKQNQIIENLESIERAIIERPIITQVEVLNQPKPLEEIKIKNPQKEVEVTNFPKQEFPKEIEVSNLKEQKEIKVNNLNEIKIPEVKEISIKKPKWFKQVDLVKPIKSLLKGLTLIGNTIVDKAITRILERLDKLVDVDASKHKNPKEALAVKLTDKNGKLIDEKNPLFRFNIPSGGGGGGPHVVGLKRKNNDQIDPVSLREFGEKTGNPETNTLLARLKTLEGGQNNIISAIDSYFFAEVSLGNIPGATRQGRGGTNEDINADSEEHIGALGGGYDSANRYLSANTTLFLSSTDAGDNQIWGVTGLWQDGNGDWVRVTRLVTLNGQNQVALNAQLIRVDGVFNIDSSKSDGDIYLAESDTLTDGVPNTESKQKYKSIAGRQASNSALYTVPSNKEAYIFQLSGSVGEANDAKIFFRVRAPGSIFQAPFPFPIFQQPFGFFEGSGFILTEKFDVEFTCETQDASATAMVAFEILEFDV